jgi:peptidoglycan-associated lipoprotein
MKGLKYLFFTTLMTTSLLFLISSCCRQPTQVWDDTKSCGRYMKKGMCALSGKYKDSRQVRCKDEFVGWQEEPVECEFTAFNEDSYGNEIAMADYANLQPRETPGEAGSSIPGIEYFRDPATVSSLKGIFRNIHFEYNSNLIKGSDNVDIVRAIADYMRTHPNVYIFVEGHADERGPEAYNLALGARRCNSVRTMLIEQGVNSDNVFTISYGKERPLLSESNEDAWSQNRRAEFKVYYH